MQLFNAFLRSSILSIVLVGILIEAHPGHDHQAEAEQRAAFMASAPLHKRSLSHCYDRLTASGNEQRMMERRMAMADNLREKRSIEKRSTYLRARDLETFLSTDHESNLTGITVDTEPSVLFSGNNTCILTPEATEGPYYVQGEYVRQDVVETQEGVRLALDMQVIDVNTCEPLPEVYVEVWNCNSTGVYGGIEAAGNGNPDDKSIINATFLRGIQKTDSDGVLTFDTLFPGHYTGRATHIHVLAHLNATLLPNSTITGGTVAHVGQIYFDQSLITEVEQLAPYNTNQAPLTTNADDILLQQTGQTDVDPFVHYVYLGDNPSDGLLSWISFGIDSGATRDVHVAVSLGSDGGVPNPTPWAPPAGVANFTSPPAAGGAEANGTASGVSSTGAASAIHDLPGRLFNNSLSVLLWLGLLVVGAILIV